MYGNFEFSTVLSFELAALQVENASEPETLDRQTLLQCFMKEDITY